MKERITKSSGNVFIDLGFPPEEAAVLAMRSELMAKLRTLIDERGKWEKSSLDMLVTLAARAAQRSNIVLKAA